MLLIALLTIIAASLFAFIFGSIAREMDLEPERRKRSTKGRHNARHTFTDQSDRRSSIVHPGQKIRTTEAQPRQRDDRYLLYRWRSRARGVAARRRGKGVLPSPDVDRGEFHPA